MLKALPTLFPHLGTASTARAEFYNKFQREADEFDRDFIKKYDEDLNTTLIFVSFFSLFFFFVHLSCEVDTLPFLGGIGRSVLRGHICFYY